MHYQASQLCTKQPLFAKVHRLNAWGKTNQHMINSGHAEDSALTKRKMAQILWQLQKQNDFPTCAYMGIDSFEGLLGLA